MNRPGLLQPSLRKIGCQECAVEIEAIAFGKAWKRRN
jgi:hypothetical protein